MREASMDQRQREMCSECGKVFVRDDSVESLGGRLVHTRCLPRTPRFAEDPEPAPDPEPEEPTPA